MPATARALHYVCTHDEARRLIAAHDRFWVSNCGCRESRAACNRSRIDPRCDGCGLCVEVCPQECVEMVPRGR